MSGHSKWHNIQKTKGAADAKRSATFTKIAKEIIVAVKQGGSGDPANNSRLATVIAKAKAANMPNDNIKRTIDKALGSGNTDSFENVTYEGYGPNGVAVIIEALTDNRNRTAPEVRHLLDKYGKEVPGTWAELVATAKEIVEQEGSPDLKGFVSYWKQNESLTSSMLEIYWEKGARIIGEDGSCVIDEALLAETLAEMKQMMDLSLIHI